MRCYQAQKKAAAGFTLPELIVAMGIGVIALATVTSLSIYTLRSFSALGNYVQLDMRSRNALDQMTSKIRQADELIRADSDSLVLRYHTNEVLSYVYSPSDRTLTETLGEHSTTLLEGCDFLQFALFQRNTAEGTYDQFPANATNAVKLVQVSWKCSRSTYYRSLNTETVESAKIVIRNQ